MRLRPVTGSSVLLGKASAVGPTRPRTAESGCGSDLLASPSACVQKVGWVHLVVRHILLAEPMVADFGRCFEGLSPDEAEALADSFRLDRCVQRRGLVDILRTPRETGTAASTSR